MAFRLHLANLREVTYQICQSLIKQTLVDTRNRQEEHAWMTKIIRSNIVIIIDIDRFGLVGANTRTKQSFPCVI